MGKKTQGQGPRGRGAGRGGGGSSGAPSLAGPLVWTSVAAALGAAYFWKWWSARREAFLLLNMREWLRQQGGLVDNVEVKLFTYPGGAKVRGYAATKDIPAGAEIANAPRLAMLSDFTIDARIIKLVEVTMDVENAHDPTMARDIALAAGVLREKHLGENSNFLEFMKSIPTPAEQPDNVPWWDEQQLAVLGSVLNKFVIWRRLMLNTLLEMSGQHGALIGHNTEEDCIWALSVVVSRQVHGMLMPLLDLANHAVEPTAEMQYDDFGVRQVAKRDIAKGEEVTITYGLKPNLHLLQAYGFAIPGNNLSALSVDVGRLNASEACAGGKMVSLHHTAPLAVAPKAAECLESTAGRCEMLRVLSEECQMLHGRLWPPEGRAQPLHAMALGIHDPREALRALRERAPKRAVDDQLVDAVQEELRTLARCADETARELAASRQSGMCDAS